MVLDYHPYTRFDLNTGDVVEVAGRSWSCVVPCAVIGATVDGNVPVLEGSDGSLVLNDQELLPVERVRTPGRPGQVPAEVITLADYLRVHPDEMKGKRIVDLRYTTYELIIVADDKTYIRLEAVPGYSGGFEMEETSLKMVDLHGMGLLEEGVWETYQSQLESARQESDNRSAVLQLRQAVKVLGIEAAKAALEPTPAQKSDWPVQLGGRKSGPV